MVGSVAFAEEAAKKSNSAFTWSFYSNYIWQGLELNTIPLSKVKAPGQGVSFTPWRTLNYGVNNLREERSKPRGLLTYQDNFALTDQTALNWRLGWLTYDTEAGETEKAFAGFGLNTFLSPEVSLWKGKEFNQDSWTLNFALSQDWHLNNSVSTVNGWTFGLGSGMSYSNFDNADYDDVQNANVWADLNIPFNDGVSLTPSVNYSYPVNDSKKSLSGEGNFRGVDSGFVFGSVDLKVPF
jgi:hypothetical protein